MPPRTDHERNAAIWRAWCAGRSQYDIAAEHSISQARVSQIVREWREALPQETKQERALKEIAFLDELRSMAMEVAKGHGVPVTAGKDGEIVYDPTHTDAEGKPLVVRDHAGRLAAMSLAQSTSKDIRKVLGLDAPTRTEISGGVRHELVGVDPEDLV